MKQINRILFRSIVTPFYKQIAGALYFLFFLLFAIQPGLEQALDTHYYIIIGILENHAAFLAYLLLCFIFSLKCVAFYLNRSNKKEYSFLQLLNSISFIKRSTAFLFCAFVLLLPISIYTGCIIGVGISANKTEALLFPCVLFIAFPIFLIVAFNYINKKPASFSFITLFKLKKQPSALWWFLLKYIFREQFFALFIIKMISFCSIYFFVITDTSVFESRILWLIFMLCLAAHSIIIYKNFYFIDSKLSFYKTLPIKPVSIVSSLFLCYTILLVPEYWALRSLAVSHNNIYEYICIIITAPSILTLLHVLLYTDHFKMDGYLSIVFLVWMVFFFLGFAATKWLLPLVAVFGFAMVFFTSFRSFESNAKAERLE